MPSLQCQDETDKKAGYSLSWENTVFNTADEFVFDEGIAVCSGLLKNVKECTWLLTGRKLVKWGFQVWLRYLAKTVQNPHW